MFTTSHRTRVRRPKRRALRRRGLMALVGATLVLTTLGLTACGNASSVGEGSSNASSDKLDVVASFYPMADFAQKVGGSHVRVTNLVPAGTEPHEWEPSPSDVKKIQGSNVFIYNGADMEGWVDDTLSSVDTSRTTVCKASDGIKLRMAAAEDESDEASSTDEHEHAGEHDPHVWLSPKNAKAELKNIEQALIKADPDNKTDYQANYKKYAEKFDELDEQYKNELSKVKGHSIVVSHEAYGYLCDEFGLTQMPITGMDAEGEPDAKTMAQIVQFIKDNNVKTVFGEDLVSQKVAKTIADETGAECVQLNPIEGLTDKQLKDGEDYLSVMKDNLKKLVKALDQE